MHFSLDSVADPPQLRVTVTGELDVLSSTGLGGEVARRMRDGCNAVVLDLQEVTFIDCGGLSAVLSCQQQVSASGGSFTLDGRSGAVRRVIDLTGVGSRLRTGAAGPA